MTILIVDDDELMRDMLVQLMQRHGYTATSASNGAEALNHLAQGTYSLIITDIVMPDMEGLEFIMQLKKSHPALPIIAISGGARVSPEHYLDLARQFGARYCFTKPLENELLLEKVALCLRGCGETASLGL
jgi:CheY-like chemotaxis protein